MHGTDAQVSMLGRRMPAERAGMAVLVALLFQALFLPLAHALSASDRQIAWLELCTSEGVHLAPVDLSTLAADDPQRALLIHGDCLDCTATVSGSPLPATPATAAWGGRDGSSLTSLATGVPVAAPRSLRPPSRASPF